MGHERTSDVNARTMKMIRRIGRHRYYKRVDPWLRTISCGAGAPRPCFWTAALLLVALSAAAQPRTQAPNAPDELRLFPLRVTWTIDLPAEPAGSPVADAQHVYLPLRNGQIAALARDDGWPQWLVEIETTWPVASDGGLVFAATSEGVRALRAMDGSEAWRAPVGALMAPPVAQAGWLIVGTREGNVLAFRASDGAAVWHRSFGSPLTAAPAIQGDRVFLPLGDGRVVALQLLHGDPVWERRLGGRPGGVLALPERVYVGASDNFLYCLTMRDGELDWRWRTAADVTAAPVADEARVYFVSLDNVLRALDRRSGVQRWRTAMPTRPFGSPQVAAGRVLALMPVARVPFYAADTGRLAESLDVPAPLAVATSFVELSPAGGSFVVATIDSGGASQLHAVAPGRDPHLTPLGDPPGLVLGPVFPLPSRVLPLVLTAPPALPKRGG